MVYTKGLARQARSWDSVHGASRASVLYLSIYFPQYALLAHHIYAWIYVGRYVLVCIYAESIVIDPHLLFWYTEDCPTGRSVLWLLADESNNSGCFMKHSSLSFLLSAPLWPRGPLVRWLEAAKSSGSLPGLFSKPNRVGPLAVCRDHNLWFMKRILWEQYSYRLSASFGLRL